jgi:hypothetical protein
VHRPELVRQGDDRASRTQARDRGRSAACERRNEHGRGSERLGEVTGCVRHRVADRRVFDRLGDLMPVTEARLDRTRDAIHRLHRLHWVLAHRRLAGEHDRRRAVQDRVGDVTRLGTCRLGVVDHRLEHLRRSDHGLPPVE